MNSYQGDYGLNAIVYLPFTTHDKDGGAVAPLTAFETADVKLFKNGSTERGNVAGYTMTSPLGGIVGLHLLSIDTADNTVAGFFAAGGEYFAALSPDTETIDTEIALAVIGSFSIERTNGALARLKAVPAVDVTKWEGHAVHGHTVEGIPVVQLHDSAGAGGINAPANFEDLSIVDTTGLVDITQTAADKVWSTVARVLTAGTNIVLAKGTGVTGLNDLSADNIHDEVVEGTLTFRQIIRILLAFAAGKSSGGGTATIKFQDVADTIPRITATTDANGNRTAITLDGT
jgi:hypothetical protein